MLRGIDLALALWATADLGRTEQTYPEIADALGISLSQAHESMRRLGHARLIDPTSRLVDVGSLANLLEHGVRFVFAVHPGPLSVGVPTAHSAAPLHGSIRSDDALVWPHSSGQVRGHAVEPLHKSVPQAAIRDPTYHELMALVDAIRVGKARERSMAIHELRARLLK